ncbi:hypothetical protein PRI8871_03029 [Pseudoprimorskyibacter insulae]|uniref:Uncharacterized protein n=1 Tax=Pseudoprimorskyibacter insulae TaxID=1695997 RepID=A0A2R8AZ11_9RHOB|nr:hypothetical protein PRI8871_03029 [Pseudoprimorskyibacter insulae]
MAADAASQENMLPAALKAQVIYLAEFTQAHSAKVLRGQADIAPLLDVNIAVLKGLKMQEIRE